MNNEEQLHYIEISMENAKKAMELGQCLERLHSNPDFKRVILEDFFKEESVRAVMLQSDPNMYDPEKQTALKNIMISICGLYQYFAKVYRLADSSSRAITDAETTREELLNEALTSDEI